MVRLYFGLLRPRKKVLGAYLAGDVDIVGKAVKGFKPGDPIFACSGPRFGAYAEYICLSEKAAIALKPDNMTYEEASAVPLGLDALHFLRMARIQKGEKVLVIGAGGGIGTMAVQLAIHFGADVTAVDRGEKLDLLRSIGAAKVLDYTQEDFAQSGATYDVIFDLVGKQTYHRSLKSLKNKGRYLLVNPNGLFPIIRGLWTSMVTNKKVVSQFASAKPEDMIFLKELIEQEKLVAVMDKRYPLNQVVEAHTYVESGRKKGNVVLTLEHGNDR